MANIIKNNHLHFEQDKKAQNQLIEIVESLEETRRDVMALSGFFPSEFQSKHLLSHDGLVESGRRLRNLQHFLWEYIERLNKFRKDYIEDDVMQRKG